MKQVVAVMCPRYFNFDFVANGLMDVKFVYEKRVPSVEFIADDRKQCVRAKIMVAQLYDVYHSATHVCLRLQCGGMQDLYHRLKTREPVGHGDRSLSCRKVVSIISQCVSAVAHLHVGPQFAHRGIMPANVILLETADDATILLSDFGVARIGTR